MSPSFLGECRHAALLALIKRHNHLKVPPRASQYVPFLLFFLVIAERVFLLHEEATLSVSVSQRGSNNSQLELLGLVPLD